MKYYKIAALFCTGIVCGSTALLGQEAVQENNSNIRYYGEIVVSTGRGDTYRSIDGGKSWNREGVAAPHYGEIIVSTGRGDAYRSIDGGKSWAKEREAVADAVEPYEHIVCENGRGEAYVSLDGGATWHTEKQGTKIEALGNSSVEMKHRVTVFPNPATVRADVHFSVEEPALVSLRVYSMEGREVAHSERQYSAGEHILSVDVARLPSGTYAYTLAIGAVSTQGLMAVRQ